MQHQRGVDPQRGAAHAPDDTSHHGSSRYNCLLTWTARPLSDSMLLKNLHAALRCIQFGRAGCISQNAGHIGISAPCLKNRWRRAASWPVCLQDNRGQPRIWANPVQSDVSYALMRSSRCEDCRVQGHLRTVDRMTTHTLVASVRPSQAAVMSEKDSTHARSMGTTLQTAQGVLSQCACWCADCRLACK